MELALVTKILEIATCDLAHRPTITPRINITNESHSIDPLIPHQDDAEIVSEHLDAMIHQGKKESHEISHQIGTQPALLVPQYTVPKKNMMRQPEKESKVILINRTQIVYR